VRSSVCELDFVPLPGKGIEDLLLAETHQFGVQ
jgi:hypothetical protein